MTTLLLIEDSEAHRASIRAAVEPAGIFDCILEAPDGLTGLRLLLSERVDVVLCDLELPGLDGEKLLHLRSQMPEAACTPLLFLTGNTDMERRARLLQHGASDAISKPFHTAELVARLRLHLRVTQLQNELIEKNEMLEKLSTMDALTGLRSRRYATEYLAVEFMRARRYRTPLAVLMADLDRFKNVNDSFGHLAGDAVLRGTASLLVEMSRNTDVAARYGGEELMLVLAQNTAEGGRVLGERWREAVEKTTFHGPEGEHVRVTLSVGVADLRPGMETPQDLVAAADRALYRAKQDGRNRVEVAAD